MNAKTFALCFAALTATACDDDAQPSAPETPVETAARYAEAGPSSVGYTVLEQAGPEGEPLVVKAWYPTATARAEMMYSVRVKLFGPGADPVPFMGHAALDAVPDEDGGPYPLVVLSHGFAMNPEWYHGLAEHLASHGFVVLGPEHTEHDWAPDILRATAQRPREISQTIDLAEAGALGGTIDTARVAVVGHSYGGYTALATAGAQIELDQLVERCEGMDDPFTVELFCTPFVDAGDALAQQLGLPQAPDGLWPAQGDPRVDAIVPMAGDAFLFGAEGLASVTVPTLLIGGTGDTGSPWDLGAGLAFEHVSSGTRALVAFEGAEHFINVTTCDRLPWIEALPAEYRGYFCEDPAWDKPAALRVTRQVTTAFLMDTLVGAPEAPAALSAEVYAGVEGLTVRVARD